MLVTDIVYVITIKFFGYRDNNFFNLINLYYYICLATLINVNRYVHKRNNNNNMKDGKTGVIFWFTVYLFRIGLKENL